MIVLKRCVLCISLLYLIFILLGRYLWYYVRDIFGINFAGRKMQYTLVRSQRKTISIEIKPDLSVIVRAPWMVPARTIDRFVEEKRPWIEKKLAELSRRSEASSENSNALSYEEIKRLSKEAAAYIPGRVEYFSKIVGVTYGRITVRNQKTRWGSCSSKGNLNFNCYLMLAPREVLDYVVVHELCHRKQMNHSDAFWREVEKVLPDYKIRRKWLKDNGNSLMGKDSL